MSWPAVELQELALKQKGAIVSGPFGSNIGSRFFVEEGVPVIRGNNLTKGQGKFIDDGFVFLTESKAAEFPNCVAIADDIVFTAAGSIGQVGLIPSDSRFKKYIISNKQLRIRLDKEYADPLFVYYWLSSKGMIRYLENMNNGGAVPLLNLGIIRKVPIPRPTVETQRHIASILSAYDDLIENNRRRIQLLEQAARLLYKEWFVHFRFPGHEHARIIDGIPEGWEKKPLGELLTLQRGFDLPVSKRREGSFPIYASTGINGYHAEAKVKGPGVVTGRSGSLGTVMYVSGDFWPLNTTLWIKEFKLVGPHYANHLLANMQLEQYNGGAAVPTLNRNDVHRVEVLSPPTLLLRVFEEQSSEIVKQIDTLTSMNLKLAEARDLLLPKLMNGEGRCE